MIYHQTVLGYGNHDEIISACGSRYDGYSEYQLLIRAINERRKCDADGKLTLKGTHAGMDSNIMQNHLDAICRKKVGEEYRATLPML